MITPPANPAKRTSQMTQEKPVFSARDLIPGAEPMRDTLPTFFIFGATKSGTSSLYHYLRQHPAVFMSNVKEPHFFGFPENREVWEIRGGKQQKSSFIITDYSAYRQLFETATEPARGEASVMYIYLPEAARRIKAAVPDAKLVAVLRNPVARAYSAYLHLLREEQEPCPSFLQALDAEPGRIAEGWAPLYHYQNMGFYHQQLSRFYEQFSPDQLKIFLYEDLEQNPQQVTREIYDFIGVDPGFTPDTATRHNISGVPKSQLLHRAHRFLKESSSFKSYVKKVLPSSLRAKSKRQLLARLEATNLRKPPLEAEAKARLIAAYRDDVGALQELLGRDLTHWLS